MKFRQDGTNNVMAMPQLELPFMLSYAATKKISVDAGPVISVRLNSQRGFMGDTYEIEYWKIVTYGVNGGVRYKIHPKLSVACRYYRAIKSIAAHYEVFDWATYDVKRLKVKEFDNNIQLSAYWQLNRK